MPHFKATASLNCAEKFISLIWFKQSSHIVLVRYRRKSALTLILQLPHKEQIDRTRGATGNEIKPKENMNPDEPEHHIKAKQNAKKTKSKGLMFKRLSSNFVAAVYKCLIVHTLCAYPIVHLIWRRCSVRVKDSRGEWDHAARQKKLKSQIDTYKNWKTRSPASSAHWSLDFEFM